MDIKKIITSLDEDEKDWWVKKTIPNLRLELIKQPKQYVEKAVEIIGLNKSIIEANYDKSIRDLRETAWNLYLEDELKFHNEVISYLVKNRKYPAEILQDLADKTFEESNELFKDKEKLLEKLSHFVGEYAGKIMPYIYDLSLSTTNSRRSRSGKTFEAIVKTILEMMKIPFQDQSSLGETFYREHGIGKIVDLVIPSKNQYIKDRPQTMVVTMKTSLRERWQEVVEELRRTNIPSIYLLTVDEDLTPSGLTVMKQHNIKVVVYDAVKKDKFNDFTNVIGYTQFFSQEIPHYLSYWGFIK